MEAAPPNESLFRDPLESFTDREDILAHFHHLLRSTPAGTFHLLAVKGHSGTGKTFLIEYLSKRVCPQAGWQTGVLAFVQSFPDFRSILDGLEDGLKGCVPRQSLKEYRAQREGYKRSFDEYRASITVNQQVQATDSSSVSQSQMNAQVNAELRRRELQLRAELARALLELAEECEHPLCLFVDGYERLVETDPEQVGWLWEEVLLKLPKNAPQPVLIVTCGWEYPMSAGLQPFSTYETLDDFDLLRIQSYLQTQGIILLDTSVQQTLISAFYDLTRGHPLVLALAVAYFQALPESERTVDNLRAQQPLLTEEARVQWLEERLLNRLPNPYRTLLERGPILRTFDQAALQVLLQVECDGKPGDEVLDDQTFARLLRFPFINRKNVQGDALLEQPTFHDLTRRVRLDALRRWHPETRRRLHGAMAEYYKGLIERAQSHHPAQQAKLSDKEYAEWFAEVPEQEFRAVLEFLYHALQVEEMQVGAFNWWRELAGRAVNRWRRKQAGPLLELVRQLAEEEEPFFNRRSDHYGQYLLWSSRFLEQEARWDEALLVLQEAAQVFEQVGSPADIAGSLNNIGAIYDSRGQLDTALDYHQRALSLYEQVGSPADIALSLNNIANLYYQQGQWQDAIPLLSKALSLYEQMGRGFESDMADELELLAVCYLRLGEREKGRPYYEQAKQIREQLQRDQAS